MKNLSRSERRDALENRGFALVVTISLMILLTLIAVGMLTLSSISLRSSSGSVAMAEARSNARLSMQLALAQLQALTGPDTRVTAPALANPSTPVTGVWRSWEGSDHEANGMPKAPDYSQKNQGGDPAALPGTPEAKNRFLGWLTSTSVSPVPDPTKAVAGIANTETKDHVRMVFTGSVGQSDQRQVHVQPTMLEGKKGAIAWWTSGDNSKARINTDRVEKPNTPVAWQQRLRGNGVADAKTFSLEKVMDLPITTTIPSTGNLKLANPAADLRKVHDLTGFSRGLLTNTATGGWRRDLSLFSERFSSLPATKLPLFTLEPGKVQTYSKAQTSTHPDNPLIYPWAKYRSSPDRDGWAQVPPICSWTALADYMLQYQDLSTSSASKTAMPSFIYSHGGKDNRFNFQDQVRRCPQIARIQWIISMGSKKSSASNDPDTLDKNNYGKMMPGIVLTPVLTLWNPYNVELTVNKYEVNIQDVAPLLFTFRVDNKVFKDVPLSILSRTLQEINELEDEAKKGGDWRKKIWYQRFKLSIKNPVTLPPGACRIFGVKDSKVIDTGASNDVELVPGFRQRGGYIFFRIDNTDEKHPRPVYGTSDTRFSIESVRVGPQSNESGRAGMGIVYDILVDGQSKSAHRMVYDEAELGGREIVEGLYPPLKTKVGFSLGSIENENMSPVLSGFFAYRMASPISRDPKVSRQSTRGMLQANPLCYYSEVGFADDANAKTRMAGSGVYHPINAPYDFFFEDVNGWTDTTFLPQLDINTNSTYIVSGMIPGDGLTRCVMAELPTRPLQSIAELQHFDARNNNPIPPFQFNLIGNGSAHPIFAPDQLTVTTTYNQGMCNDDTYLLNHMLFDDWFVSSIAVDLRDFSRSQKRSINNVYKDHLELTTPLPNRFYLPARGASSPDVTQAVSNAMSTSKNTATDTYAFETIASKLEVDGMFNVNSVSLEAWKALLRQSRNSEVPYLAANGSTKTSKASAFTYPRTSISGDQGTDSGSSESNGVNPNAAEFAGHRVLTDAQIDALAEEIVKEIKKRGPFLSLSEFVNRQVSTNKDLAIASTIQKALDNLAETGASPKNPFQKLQEASVRITSDPAGTTDYKFKEAAYGWSAFGVPGWVRQADILRPLAPVLSARDDTFTIRAYGDSRDRANSAKIVAKAWCEVVVKRQAAYVDPSDPPEIAPFSPKMKSEANRRFGRRYEIVSFRWLDEAEI